MKTIKNVDEYIFHAPKELKGRLSSIRKVIKTVVPGAEEMISYGMPYYSYNGRLLYFGMFKNHIGMYIPGGILAAHANELTEYETSGATIRFPHEKKLPLPLIIRLVKARVAMNNDAS